MPKIIWEPVFFKSSTNKPLTVASVPTGINVGVFIFPLGVLIIPSLAFLNFEIKLNENSFFSSKVILTLNL